MSRVTKLLDNLPEMLRRDAMGEPPLFPPADPLQYARFLVPDLPAQPWYDAARFAWTERFAQRHAVILDELRAFLGQQEVTFRNYVGPLTGDGADAGEWHVLYLDYRGHRWDQHAARFPRMMELVDAIPRRSGTVFISRLTPGTHIPAHAGASNIQLTCHFGIVVPDGVEMRVARETRPQRAGVCTVFDDSFEHEVWNRSDQNRYNLFIQFWHPDLSDEEIAGIQKLEQLPYLQEVVKKYLVGADALVPVRN